MAKAYWVKFEIGPNACVEADDEEQALSRATELAGRKAVSVQRLPYPAEPRLNRVADPTPPRQRAVGFAAGHNQAEPTPTHCPSFCYDPRRCAGRTACPKRYACSE